MRVAPDDVEGYWTTKERRAMPVQCRRLSLMLTVILGFAIESSAEVPIVGYSFPAGGQRGTRVAARIGGCNLYDAPKLIWSEPDIKGSTTLARTDTIWFEGPLIFQPASQVREDYPRDYSATIDLTRGASLGQHTWRLATSQGATTAWGFIIGEFPEIVEDEIEGKTPPVAVTLPVTINGRIFPREDVDAWSFSACAGQVITCQIATSEFGSPLDARLAIVDAQGKTLGESLPAGNITPPISFTIPTTGDYQVQIHDVAFNGLQDHVYRLTVTPGPVLHTMFPLGGRRGTATRFQLDGTNLRATDLMVSMPETGSEYIHRLDDPEATFGTFRLDVDDFEEFLESDDRQPVRFSAPGILNGRILSAGEEDEWHFTAQKGQEYDFDVRAARLGSALDAVIRICDRTGKTLQEVDDSAGLQSDARLRWTAPEEAEYRLRIRDRLTSRSGRRFAYRVRAISAATPDFSLKLAAEAINIERGQTVSVKVLVERDPGFNEPIELTWEGVPEGVTVTSPALIESSQKEFQLALKAEQNAGIATVPVRISGAAKVGGHNLTRPAVPTLTSSGSDSIPVATRDPVVWLSVAVPTPFKFVGSFESKYISRGSTYVRKYQIQRNGFQGPLEVQLADRQGRHLQGVTAQPVVVPPEKDEFEFAVVLPPWMEIGRTCRSTLSISGVSTDPDGRQHTVSFSSNDQHNQMIALVDPGRLTLQLARTTLKARPGEQMTLPLRLQRSAETIGPVTLDFIAAKPVNGVSASSIIVPDNQLEGNIVLKFDNEVNGLSAHPVTIRATTVDHRGRPVTAEAQLTLIPSGNDKLEWPHRD
jgi:hypothetical protein